MRAGSLYLASTSLAPAILKRPIFPISAIASCPNQDVAPCPPSPSHSVHLVFSLALLKRTNRLEAISLSAFHRSHYLPLPERMRALAFFFFAWEEQRALPFCAIKQSPFLLYSKADYP